MKLFLLSVLFSLFTGRALAQSGCTDPQANNYNAEATTNDGSCTYNATSLSLTNQKTLPSTLNENSGLIYTDGKMWTLNDSGSGAYIYRIRESDGAVLQQVSITGATNTDWEAITADKDYLYIGDFGNNSNGNRTNLRVYRVSKAAIGTGTETSAPAEIISFRYEDQVIAGATGNNNTDFDCEAFFVKDGKLHLFTKEWLSPHNTKHYTLPATPGTHVAVPAETLPVDGLITGATISAQHDVVVLIGYTSDQLSLFMWLLTDITGDTFFSGNKRRLSLGSSLQGQLEGVTFTSKGNGYASSERISSFITIPPRLFAFSVASLVPYPIDQEPLPVALAAFEATYAAPYISLNWKTASERNSSYFSIERSADSITFQEAGRLTAAGNSNVPLHYTFTDRTPAAGVNYYRLKQTDLDGTHAYSYVVQLEIPETALSVTPVPSHKGQLLQVDLRGGQEQTSYVITLTGTDGKTYLLKELAGTANLSEQLRVDHLRRGMYMLQVTNSYRTYTTKVLLQ